MLFPIYYDLCCYDLKKDSYIFRKQCDSLHQAKCIGTKFCKQYTQDNKKSSMYIITDFMVLENGRRIPRVSKVNYQKHFTF